MKKSIAIIIVTVIFSGLFSSVAFADPNDSSDPTVKVVVEYTAPDAPAKQAKVERDTPADLGAAHKHLNRMRQVDGHRELSVSFR